ncbi:MAG: class I SAM-dependent methyltransferase [Myxococcota bacterium]|nr:class I SAM-dependent methyltransferase [Myxococcota bacterium]
MTLARTDAPFDERLIGAATGALELFGVYLGRRLGLYERLLEKGPASAPDLAAAAGIHPRYAREWLEQQAVAGWLAVEGADCPADARRYRIEPEQAAALVDPEHASHLAPLSEMVVGIAKVLDDVVDAYRSGGGVPYARYGHDFRCGQGGINRPAFLNDLVRDWIPAVPAVHARLSSETPARVLDLGCGVGWSAMGIAEGFEHTEVVGIDSDAASIEAAQRHARERGADVRFVCDDGAALSREQRFDVAFLMEMLHDCSQPVAVLRAVRECLAPGGHVIVADEKVAPRFEAPGDDLERMLYGWSTVHCLPAAMAEQPSAAIGTVIREDTLRELAAEAGFGRVEVADVDAGFFRIYHLQV